MKGVMVIRKPCVYPGGVGVRALRPKLLSLLLILHFLHPSVSRLSFCKQMLKMCETLMWPCYCGCAQYLLSSTRCKGERRRVGYGCEKVIDRDRVADALADPAANWLRVLA